MIDPARYVGAYLWAAEDVRPSDVTDSSSFTATTSFDADMATSCSDGGVVVVVVAAAAAAAAAAVPSTSSEIDGGGGDVVWGYIVGVMGFICRSRVVE